MKWRKQMELTIEEGVKAHNACLLIYGVSGIGKSCFANSIYHDGKKLVRSLQTGRTMNFDTENSTQQLPVSRINLYEKKFVECSDTLQAFIEDDQYREKFDHIVIDSLDWYLAKITDYVVEEGKAINPKIKSIADFAYGTGYNRLVEICRKQISLFDKAKKKGYSISLVAHAKKDQVEDPVLGKEITKYDIALYHKAGNVFKEYCDIVAFCNIVPSGTVDETSGFGKTKTKVVGQDQRLMFFHPTSTYVAKTRYPMPKSCTLNYTDYRKAMKDAVIEVNKQMAKE